MASTSTSASADKKSFADKMRQLALESRVDPETFRAKKQESDLITFFESEVVKNAQKKIEGRAKLGCLSANILEYGFSEYFYVTSDKKVVRVEKFEERKGVYLHRIFKIVHSDLFQEKLKAFVDNELGDMTYSCWFLGKNSTNVITVRWGTVEDNLIAEGTSSEIFLDLSKLKIDDEASKPNTPEPSTSDAKEEKKTSKKGKKTPIPGDE